MLVVTLSSSDKLAVPLSMSSLLTTDKVVVYYGIKLSHKVVTTTIKHPT